MITYFIFGLIAFALYVIFSFLRPAKSSIPRVIVNLLFGCMFMGMKAYAPAVIYFSYALYGIVPVYKFTAKLPPRVSALIWQGIPAVIAIVAGYMGLKNTAMSPVNGVFSFVFPVVAILMNLAISLVIPNGRFWYLAPIARSVIWTVYFVVSGIWMSVIYEVFNMIVFLMAVRSIAKGKGASATSPESQTSETEDESSNTIGGGNSEKNVAAVYTPTVFKGQW